MVLDRQRRRTMSGASGGRHRRTYTAVSRAIAATGAGAAIAVGCGGSSSSPDTGAAAVGTYSATVTWTQPTLNTDGSPLSDATGYRVDYGASPSALSQSVTVGTSGLSATVTGLSAGVYYFAVTTLNAAGVASERSAVVSRSVP